MLFINNLWNLDKIFFINGIMMLYWKSGYFVVVLVFILVVGLGIFGVIVFIIMIIKKRKLDLLLGFISKFFVICMIGEF